MRPPRKPDAPTRSIPRRDTFWNGIFLPPLLGRTQRPYRLNKNSFEFNINQIKSSTAARLPPGSWNISRRSFRSFSVGVRLIAARNTSSTIVAAATYEFAIRRAVPWRDWTLAAISGEFIR